MNRTLILTLAAALAACAGTKPAQQPAAEAPPQQPAAQVAAKSEPAKLAEPADPAPVTDGDVTDGRIGGMQVLVQRVPGAELVAARLYLLGGARNWTAADAGVEQLALQVAANGGTQSLDKDAFARRLATLGSTVHASTSEDGSYLAAKSLRENWDATFELLADAALRPALPAAELELQRERQLTALRREQEDPDARLELAANEAFFKGHPFANRAVGTEQSVRALTLAQLRSHLEKLRETGRLMLVVVGDVEAARVLEQAKRAFGGLPRGTWRDEPLPLPRFDQPSLRTVEAKLPTNYVQGTFPSARWTDPEFPAALVAHTALQDRVFLEVRTKRNLSYAPGLRNLYRTAAPRAWLYVTAVDPKATLPVMADEARKLRDQPLPEKDLAGYRAMRLTRMLMQAEGLDDQAAALADAQFFAGDWRAWKRLPEQIRKVTAADVQAYARKHMTKLQTTVLGPAKVEEGWFGSL